MTVISINANIKLGAHHRLVEIRGTGFVITTMRLFGAKMLLNPYLTGQIPHITIEYTYLSSTKIEV